MMSRSVFMLMVLLCLAVPVIAHSGQEAHKILVLHSYHPGLVWSDNIMEGIYSVFSRNAADIDMHVEYMDTKRHFDGLDGAYFARLRELYRLKYGRTKFDVIISSDDDAFQFLLRHHRELFPGTPIVFCGVNNFTDSMLQGHEGITGVVEFLDQKASIDVALKLHPDTRQIAIITDPSTTGRANRKILEGLASEYRDRVEFLFLDENDSGLTLRELLERLKTLTDHTIVYYADFLRSRGEYIAQEIAVPQISSASRRPLYTHYDEILGLGIVGGKLVNGQAHGRAAADMALQIIRGVPVSSLPVYKKSINRYMFDHTQLTRFHIHESALPADSILINEPRSLYRENRKLIWFVLSVMAGLAGMVVVLAVNIYRRKKAEVGLREARDRLEVRVEERTAKLRDANLLLNQEIAEREQAEKALIENEKRFRSLLEGAPLGVVLLRGSTIVYANPAFVGMHGYAAAEEIIGRPITDMTAERGRTEVAERAMRRQKGLPAETTFEVAALRKDGPEFTAMVHATMIDLADGPTTLAFVQDTTEKHLLEEERLKTQKLEAIGTLAGGIAHDFNNLLQGVFGYIAMARLTLDQKDRALTMLQQAEQALHLSVNLTTQLLTFSKGGKPVKKRLSLKPVIENSVRFALSGSSADYRIRIDEDLWQVEADQGQIGQVIQNIVINADQAMPLGGTVIIGARNVSTQEKDLPLLRTKGKYVEISVQDSGIGIPAQYLSRIFDPYFSTKEKGSGLGLATSYSIIRNHGGVLDVASEGGRGTTFFIYLPAVEAAKETPAVPPVPAFAGRANILVMDDEELLRNIAGEMIAALGHDVDVAENGEAAIRKYLAAREAGRPFDIVILDLTIRGGMGGAETIQRLAEIDPGVRAIVSSGYSDDAVIADYRQFGFRARMTKPYKLEALRDTLNSLLAS